ncbi:MAG: hypothetical protein J1E81_06825 [Eubacterium sp.]|nr:hypothetical protein [Eubacterium sp.]
MKKGKFKILTVAVSALCMAALVTACGGDDTPAAKCTEHKWNDGEIVTTATCGERGIKKFTCTVCSDTKTERYGEATGAHSYDGKECSVCGYVDMSDMTAGAAIAQYGYYHVDADDSHTVNTGDHIHFGSYPQAEVKDGELTATLAGKLSSSGWTSYGYYAEGALNDGLMSYQDVTDGDAKYRAVKIDGYRPFYTDLAATSANSIVYENGYRTGNIYWFAFAPIEWRVLDYGNGEAMLNTADCIDSQSYNNTYDKNGAQYYNKGTEIFSNEWEHSAIRSYLNGTFFNTAFSSAEQAKMVQKTLSNSDTGFNATSNYSVSQRDTNDKVYLLSYQDLLNKSYGFPNDMMHDNNDPADLSVCKLGTDYALCQGARTSVQSPGSWWMLRSAGGKSFSICGVTKYGSITNSNTASYTPGNNTKTEGIAFNTSEGVSPVVNIKIGK